MRVIIIFRPDEKKDFVTYYSKAYSVSLCEIDLRGCAYCKEAPFGIWALIRQ